MSNGAVNRTLRADALARSLTAAIVATLTGATAVAQEENPALEEIVVTAQRKAEKLERTPVTVTAIQSEDLQKQAIRSEGDLQIAVPGLLVRQGGASNVINFVIRGQTLDVLTGSQPAVLPYFNEVPVYSAQPSSFYDLQSIQVLKGPQGTLFGRNATGGAVLLTTVRPDPELSGYISFRGGNFDYHAAEGAVNIPLGTDQVLLRLAGSSENRDGFVYNAYTDNHLGSVDRQAWRATLEIAPSDAFTSTTVVDYTESGGTNVPQQILSLYLPGQTNEGYPLNSLIASVAGPNLDAFFGIPGAWAAYLAAHPNANPMGAVGDLSDQQAHGPYWVNSAGSFNHQGRAWLISNVSTYDISEDLQIKNVFGYSNVKTVDYMNVGSLSSVLQNSDPEFFENEVVSEELQLIGSALNGKLSYVGGVFFSDAKSLIGVRFNFAKYPPLVGPTRLTNGVNQYNTTHAAYVQGTADLSELTGIGGLGLTLGLRYTQEKIKQVVLPESWYYPLLGTGGLEREMRTSTDEVSWQVGLQDQVTDNLLVYAVTRHSFRSGGFNGQIAPVDLLGADGGARFAPETVTDVEVGVKARGTIGSASYRASAAVYSMWIDDIQRSAFSSNAAVTLNVPKARVRGFEVDFEVQPTDWLGIGLNAAYTDAEFTEREGVVFGTHLLFGPYSDTPEWSGALFVEGNFVLPGSTGDLTLRADISSQSKVHLSSLGDTVVPFSTIPGYTLLNLRASLDNIGGSNVSIAGYIRNATDEEYFSGGAMFGAALGANGANPGIPRTYYLEATFRF